MIFTIDKHKVVSFRDQNIQTLHPNEGLVIRDLGFIPHFSLVCYYILKGQKTLAIIRKIIEAKQKTLYAFLVFITSGIWNQTQLRAGLQEHQQRTSVNTLHSLSYLWLQQACEVLRACAPIPFFFLNCRYHVEQTYIKQRLEHCTAGAKSQFLWFLQF